MKRAVRRALVLLVLLTAARLTSYAFGHPSAGVANRAYVLALGALVAWLLLTYIRRFTATPAYTPFHDACRPATEELPRPSRLAALEDLARFGADKAQGRHFHLRPYLRDLMAHRLAARGVDLDIDPAAPTLLGPVTWQLVCPDAAPPDDPRRPGLTEAEVLALTESMEQLR